MTTLSLDIETRSSVNLLECGVTKYVESPDFTILLFSFSYGNVLKHEPVTTIDLTCEELPHYVVDDLTNPDVIKTAFNAFFERNCIGAYLGLYMPPSQWRCTMVKVATLGLPLGLSACAKALQLETLKETEGTALIKYFSVPHEITKKDIMDVFTIEELAKLFPGADENLSQIGFRKECVKFISEEPVLVYYESRHNPEKWERYKQYNNTDVKVEIEILEKVKWHSIPSSEQALWEVDQEINERGICMDMQLINNAIAINDLYRGQLMAEAVELTGLANPNARNQVKAWLEKEMPEEDIPTLKKDDVTKLLKLTDGLENKEIIDRVLVIRQELSKTSINKYFAMVNFLCKDGRAHGLLQFYGANRTGRWAGRGIQFQNLRRIDLKVDSKKGIDDLGIARNVVRSIGYYEDGILNTFDDALEELNLLWGNPSDTLSQLIRTAFVPKPGHRFIVVDFSAIEARVISWLAQESWRLEVFRTHGKIYEASASKMFKIPLDQIAKDSPYRQKGKISELALGYQGAVNALLTMGALKDKNIKKEVDALMESKGLTETKACTEVLMPLVKAWRTENPSIVKMWYAVQEKAIDCVVSREPTQTHGITFFMRENVLFMKLLGGRSLAYWNAEVRENSFGQYLSYEGLNQKTAQWCRIDTYGGKICENAIQAIARDCLAHVIMKLHKKGFKQVVHVHDETVIEVPEGESSLEEICKLMAEPIPWAKGLPLAADGFEGYYYKK